MKNNYQPKTRVEHIKSGIQGTVMQPINSINSKDSVLIHFDDEEHPRFVVSNMLKEIKNHLTFW